MSGQGKRFDQGKIRTDLVPVFAQKEYTRVLTAGAEKYGDRNWEKGMKWSRVLASLERHLLAVKSGEDYDPETGMLHSAHIMCNAAFLTEYYNIYPQGDDRQKRNALALPSVRIGLDVDDVVADFIGGFCEKYGISSESITSWNDARFDVIKNELHSDKDFWLNLKSRMSPSDIPFEPVCYITSRSIPEEWTREWLVKHGYPLAPIVNQCTDKAAACLEHRLDFFVDDNYTNFIKINEAGVHCFLMDVCSNRKYNVGHSRIFDLSRFK